MDTYYEGRPPRCLACQDEVAVEHIMFHCVSFTNARGDIFCVTLASMSKLFLKVASHSIIYFIKEAGFYRKINMHVFQLFNYLNFNYFRSSFYRLCIDLCLTII